MLKKIRKSILGSILAGSLCLMTAVSAFAASTPSVSLPSTSGAYFEGFTSVRSMPVKFNTKKGIFIYKKKFYKAKDKSLGMVHTYVGRYRCKKKVDGKIYDALLIKVNMEPDSFKAGTVIGNLARRKFYAYSEDLKLSAKLPAGCTIQNSYPNNDTTLKQSYSVGINGSTNGAGKNAGIAANVSMSSAICSITDKSSIKKRTFYIEYDYKNPFLPKFGSDAKSWTSTLFNSTWQMASVEWTSKKNSIYTVKLKVEAVFGIAAAKSVNAEAFSTNTTCCGNKSATYKETFKANANKAWKVS